MKLLSYAFLGDEVGCGLLPCLIFIFASSLQHYKKRNEYCDNAINNFI